MLWLMAFATFLAVAVPDAALIVVFSAIGYGPQVYGAVADKNMDLIGNGLAFLSTLWMVFLFVIDFLLLPAVLQVPFGLVLMGLLSTAATLKGASYPWAAMLLLLCFSVMLLGQIRVIIHRASGKNPRYGYRFYFITSASFGVCAVLVIALWTAWMVPGDHMWDQGTRDWLISKNSAIYGYLYKPYRLDYTLHCSDKAHLSSLHLLKDDEAKILRACKQAKTVWFLQWSSPFLVFMCNALCCVFCALFGYFLFQSPTRIADVANDADKQLAQLRSIIKSFTLVIVLTLAFMYCSLYVAGASSGLSSAMLCLGFASCTALLGWVYLEVPRDVLMLFMKTSKDSAGKSSGTIESIIRSDWMRALMVWGLHVFIPFMAVLDMIRKQVRICRQTNQGPPEDKFTARGRDIANLLDQWNWTSIFGKVILIGELFILLLVGSKATFVFFSWLNEEIEGAALGFGIVSLTVWIIGVTMFLCPIVPGSAVYLFSGVVLGAQSQIPGSIGFWKGTAIACLVGSVAKLLACVGQYLLGFAAGKFVKVQQFVGVDQVPTRAMEKVLKRPGFSLGKVCILVAGPDFPTSVLCGILKLNVPQMLLGTSPVILVSVIPQTLVGALLTKESGDGGAWAMISTAATGLAAAFQAGATLIFTYSIMKTVEKDVEELSQNRPEHDAVARLTAAESAYKRTLEEVCKWSTLSCCCKALLYAAVICFLLCGFGIATDFMVAEKFCFRPFGIKDRIGVHYELGGLNNNALNLVMPAGAGALGLACLGVALNWIFGKLTASQARSKMEKAGNKVSPDNAYIN